MWVDYYLKFEDEAAFVAGMPEALQAAASEVHATDVVGTLYREDTFAAVAGYHVNLRLREDEPLPAGLAAFAIEAPLYPKRVFA